MAKQSQNQPKPFAAVCRDKSSIDVVVVGADSHMYHRAYSDSSWRDWKNLGGNFTSEAPALVASSTDRLDVFARDQTTKRLIHSAWKNGSWATEWNEPDGPEFVRSITVVSSQAGQLDIFGATSESLYYRSV